MANGHGGARPGSGRKAKAIKFAGPVAEAERQIADFLPELVEIMKGRARGVMVEKETSIGPIVYKEPPCQRAGEYLFNRIAGKLSELIEISGADGEPLGPQVLVYIPYNGRDPLATEGDDESPRAAEDPSVRPAAGPAD